MCRTYQIRNLRIVLAALLLASIACSQIKPPAASETPQQTQAPEQAATQPGVAPVQPTATNTPQPSPTPIPPTPTLPPQGASRSNPFPAGEAAAIPGWDIQILEMQRGEAAWNTLKEINTVFNFPAPPGKEYVLLHLSVKCTSIDGQTHDPETYNFYVTGDRAVRYSFPLLSLLAPEPWLQNVELSSGEEMQGWGSYMVEKGEKNLILVVEKFDPNYEPVDYYIAIEPGAAVGVPEDLASIQPDSLGTMLDSPAPAEQTVTTQDWQVTVLEALRGGPAEKLLTAIHSNNKPLTDGMEYLLVWVKIRFIGSQDQPIWEPQFKVVTSQNQEYEKPEGAIAPQPWLLHYLYPGGEMQGWVVVQTPQNEANPRLVFYPPLNSKDRRFLSVDIPPAEAIPLQAGNYLIGPAAVEIMTAYESQTTPLGDETAPQGQKYIIVRMKTLWIEPGETFETGRVILITGSGKKYGQTGVYKPGIFESTSENPEFYLYFTVDQVEDLLSFAIAYGSD